MTKQLANLRKADRALGDDPTLTRWVKGPARHTRKLEQPMAADATGTRFKTRVLDPDTVTHALTSGQNNVKIGRDVRKGRLKGYWIYTLSLEERATCPSSCLHWRDCVDPDAKVLKADLSWAAASDIKVGDRVAGFDEHSYNKGHRKTSVAVVERVETLRRPRLEIVTDRGVLVTSAGHLWLTKRDRKGYQWRRADDLRVGDVSPFFASPWDTAQSYDAGRLRGFVEGEGHCVDMRPGMTINRNSVGWSQRPTKLVDEIIAIAHRLGFSTSRFERKSGINRSDVSLVEITGGWRETTKFIGMLRPTRMIEKAEALWANQWIAGRNARHAKILAINVLPAGDVVAIQTSTNTMVVDGFFTHNCYGNNMPFAKRMRHGPELEQKIVSDVEKLLDVRNRRGILVRLHALGDFYSVDYVRFWEQLLDTHERLAVFGYTARGYSDPIGSEVARLRAKFGNRFAVRWSDGPLPFASTVSIASEAECPDDAFVCPEQTGKTQCCATCGACWSTMKNVAFLAH